MSVIIRQTYVEDLHSVPKIKYQLEELQLLWRKYYNDQRSASQIDKSTREFAMNVKVHFYVIFAQNKTSATLKPELFLL